MTKEDDKTLSDRQRKALPFFVSSRSYEEGCRQAKVSKHAFYSWLQNPTFKGELDRLRDSVVDEAVSSLKANITKATDVLVSLLDRKENPMLCRAVANDIIGHVAKFRELQQLENRLEALEQRIGSEGRNGA